MRQDINGAILLFFFLRHRTFLGYKCVSIQNSTWILSHQLTVSIALHRRRLAESASLRRCKVKWIVHAGISGREVFSSWPEYLLRDWLSSRHGNGLSSRLSSRDWVAEVEQKRKCQWLSSLTVWVELEHHRWLFNNGKHLHFMLFANCKQF